MTTFSASLTNLTALLPQSRDSSCYVSRPILAPPPLWLQKHTDLRAHDFAHCPDLWHQPRLANVTCAWSWRLCGINPDILNHLCDMIVRYEDSRFQNCMWRYATTPQFTQHYVREVVKSYLVPSSLSVLKQKVGSHWTDFHETLYLRIFGKTVGKIQVLLKSDVNNEYFTWRIN